MMFAVENLNDARTIFARHGNAVAVALKEYREKVQLCDGRFAADYAAQEKTEAKSAAAGKVAQADKEMHDAIMTLVKVMRRNVRYVVTDMPNNKVISALDVYRKHNIRMNETEIRAYAEHASDSYVALRILQSLAQKSGFNVAFPSIESVENDIRRIEKAAYIPAMYAPPEYAREACEVMGKIPYFREDGSVYAWGNNAELGYVVSKAEARARLDADMGGAILDRWKGVQPVTVAPVTEEEQAAEDKQTAEEQAKAERRKFAENLSITSEDDPNTAAIMAQNEAAAKQSRGVLAHYLGK